MGSRVPVGARGEGAELVEYPRPRHRAGCGLYRVHDGTGRPSGTTPRPTEEGEGAAGEEAAAERRRATSGGLADKPCFVQSHGGTCGTHSDQNPAKNAGSLLRDRETLKRSGPAPLPGPRRAQRKHGPCYVGQARVCWPTWPTWLVVACAIQHSIVGPRVRDEDEQRKCEHTAHQRKPQARTRTLCGSSSMICLW